MARYDYIRRIIAKYLIDNPGSGEGIALGETQTTAYRGDRGAIAYDHSQATHAPSTAEQNVNADWNSVGGDSQILNKPTIPVASDLVYGALWDNNTDAPTKNAVYDKIETLSAGGLTQAQVLTRML